MKKMIVIAATAVMMAMTMAATSCNKQEMVPQESLLEQETGISVYDFELEIQAEGIPEVLVEFRDDNLTLVSADTYQTGKELTTEFSSATKPAWIYTDGLQNGDPAMGGMLRISESSIQTKAGSDSRKIVLVVKKE